MTRSIMPARAKPLRAETSRRCDRRRRSRGHPAPVAWTDVRRMGNSAVARCISTLGVSPVVSDGNDTATVLASQDLSAGWNMAHSTMPQILSVNAIGFAGRRRQRPRIAHRAVPERIPDRRLAAPLPACCPDCGGEVVPTGESTQTIEDLEVTTVLTQVVVARGRCAGVGTRIATNSPARSNLASRLQSLLSVLTRSPGGLRDERWSHHLAAHPQPLQLSAQLVTGRPRLIDSTRSAGEDRPSGQRSGAPSPRCGRSSLHPPSRRGEGLQRRWSPCAHPSRGESTSDARHWTPAGSFLRGGSFCLRVEDPRPTGSGGRPFHDD